jgi:hypothetical protein
MTQCLFPNNFATTLSASVSSSATTCTIPHGDAVTLDGFVNSVDGRHVWITLVDGAVSQVVKVTDVDTGTDTLTFTPAASSSFSSGGDVEVRIPGEAFGSFQQKFVRTATYDTGWFTVYPNELVSLDTAVNCSIRPVLSDPGDSCTVFLKNTDEVGYPTIAFSPDSGKLVWEDDTPPTAFTSTSGLMRIDFSRSDVNGSGSYWSSKIIFARWSKSTIPS